MTSYPMQPKSKQSEIGDPFRAPPSGQRLYYTLEKYFKKIVHNSQLKMCLDKSKKFKV